MLICIHIYITKFITFTQSVRTSFFLKKIRFLGGSKTCQRHFEEPATRSCEKDERKEEGIISDFPANLCKCRKKIKGKKPS